MHGRTRSALLLTFACLLPVPAVAGGASAAFTVSVELRPSQDLCISQALSSSTHAVVVVVCSSGDFVSIAPRPGASFVGTHGDAFRYYLGSKYWTVPRPDDAFVGVGTVTSLRLYHVSGNDGPLEMLVTF